ncbi:amino acid ABC transporter substrate-binding protein [Permianibacter sp. IMCC34836]|uniref:amino acid ABC transporter substrate-binding protein n=1 Tax=Permianibacter fluminis TaxID=2738515 RepID=UPI0015517510|nr:amino acid ABC transporter substrate-binding protein [Permianibacter fluminis]NQD37982.1 amino acid ABC transporter substrate-binding protein [Permianibacter fluminis]
MPRCAPYLIPVCCALLLQWLPLPALADPKLVIYPGDAPRYAEYIELLRTALDRTSTDYGPYVLKPADQDMNEARFLVEARSGTLINVVWSATSIEKEKTLLPVRIPLEKGLLGYRIGLIRAGSQARFDQVKTAQDLLPFEFGLGPGWGDIDVYQAAGFKVQLAPYEELFAMTAFGRFDYFSRGVNEVFAEFDVRQSQTPNLEIEQGILLHYPYPFYFFVTPTDPKLAERIERGLQRMLADGSFDLIFHKYNNAAIKRANFSKRRLIELPNRNLPPQTPLRDARLWYRPR